MTKDASAIGVSATERGDNSTPIRESGLGAATEKTTEVSKPLSIQEQKFKESIHKALLKSVDLALINTLSEEAAREQIREISQQLIATSSLPMNRIVKKRIIKQIEDEVMGLGPLESLLADPDVADILVNGHQSIYVERKGRLEKTNVCFSSEMHLRNIIDRIVSSVGRRIDESSPMVDARLKDGSRVNIIIPPLAIDGATMSIRRFTVKRLSMENLIDLGSVPPVAATLLHAIVKGRLNVLVSGGTGSGKTTLLNILSGYIPDDERIITIEDSAELQIQQSHVVRLETRPPNVEDKGEVTQRHLVKNSLRMRPDRIVIGEVRGGEAIDMLQAMNTGHDGSLTTVHANTPRDALSRVENMVMMSGVDLPVKTVRQQIASAVNVVLQIQRFEDGRRRLVSIQEINGMEGEVVTMSELLNFQRKGVDEHGGVIGSFRATGIVPGFHEHMTQRGIELPMTLFNP
ncbi:MAG: CpaF family protein, partial [Spongiibacteraceae bacterium]|nr:CpaF family protein [Spongiibacteraceae bacterium]